MDEDQLASEILKKKIQEGVEAGQIQANPVTRHVLFTLQKIRFECMFDCYDRRKTEEEVDECVNGCTTPYTIADRELKTEINELQRNLVTTMNQCEVEYKQAKLQNKTEALNDMVVCCEEAKQTCLHEFSGPLNKMKASFGLCDHNE